MANSDTDYLWNRYEHNSDKSGFEILKQFSKTYLECNKYKTLIREMVEDADKITLVVEIKVVKIGHFAGRKLFVVDVLHDDNQSPKLKTTQFLFYRSLHGSGNKTQGEYYPIPGFLCDDSVKEENIPYMYPQVGWFIKDGDTIQDIYGSKTLNYIREYIESIENIEKV